MDVRHRLADMKQPWPREQLLLLGPILLIVVISVANVETPQTVHLGPALVIAPALTLSLAGPLPTAFIGALTVLAQVLVAVLHGGETTIDHLVQIPTLAVLSALIVSFAVVRERRARQLAQVRSVAETAQHVLLWPLPERLGPLRIACLYLAAEDEAQVGGDLYAATRTADGTRVLIGDVRGKGLPALGEAATLLGSFREVARHQPGLPELAAALDRSVSFYMSEVAPRVPAPARTSPRNGEEAEEALGGGRAGSGGRTGSGRRAGSDGETGSGAGAGDAEEGERFATALLVEIPDSDAVARMTSCGHPPPLLLGPGRPPAFADVHPAPPLGLGLGPVGGPLDRVAFGPGDTLLLYTDGVIEARDADGTFYPLTERAAHWAGLTPEALLRRLRRDLLRHAGGHLGDDVAVVAITRTTPPDGS